MPPCLDEIKRRIATEYEASRLPGEHRAWVEGVFDDIRDCPAAHDELRLKTGIFKRFIEEAAPIARVVDAQPYFNDCRVTLRAGSQPFDAEFQRQDVTEYVEVTSAIAGQLANIIGQFLNKFGFGPRTITRSVGAVRKFLSGSSPPDYVGDVVDVCTEMTECESLLSEVLQKKIQHGYTGRYHLIATFELDLDLHDINLLIQSLKIKFSNQTTFSQVFLYERTSKRTFLLLP